MSELAVVNTNNDILPESVKTATEIMQIQMERFMLKTLMEHVNEYLANYCKENPEFAAQVNNAERSLIQCMEFIKDRAKEWLKEEQKLELFQYGSGLGGAIPDEIVFGWAVEYYYTKPKPMYVPKPAAKKIDKKSGKAAKEKPAPPEEVKKEEPTQGQINLFDAAIADETQAEVKEPTCFADISEDITDTADDKDNPFIEEAVA